MRLPFSVVALLMFSAAPFAAPGQTKGPFDTSRLQTIRPRLQALVDSQMIPGAVALVARHGEVALLEAVGWRDIENKKPMEADSIFQIMSMTKNFTGVAAMMLVEQGKLELRQPVERYLPEYRGIQVQEGQTARVPKHAPTV